MEKSEQQLKEAFMEKLAAKLPKLDWHYGMSGDSWVNQKGEQAMKIIQTDLQLLSKLDGGYAAANKLWDIHRPYPVGDASLFLKDPGKYTKVGEKYLVPPETAGELLNFINERLKQGDRYVIFREDTAAITKDRLYVMPRGEDATKFLSERDGHKMYVEQSLYTMQGVVQRVVAAQEEKGSVLQKVNERIQHYEREEKRSNSREWSR